MTSYDNLDPNKICLGGGSLVPTLYHTRKKSLVKRVFNFGSVQQDLDAANQIAERSLCHGHVRKKIARLT